MANQPGRHGAHAAAADAATTKPVLDPSMFASIAWRSIGPYRGGRVVAVAGDPSEPMVFYFGACAGGVWKTTDGGMYWTNVSDGFFKTAAVGALAVAPSDPNVIYAGMGETCIRGNVSHGDGVYRSTDGGKTWTHQGLADTRHIAKIRVHPTNLDLVYVAALGHAFGPNPERGIYRSRDGGATWDQILFRSERAGAIDLSLDPANPRILYAAFWEAQRTPWSLSSGGPDSRLYRSTDGGDSWADISEHPGLPAGIKGKLGVAISPAHPGRVWAIIEAKEGGLFRSDDGGATWERICDDPKLRQRPWYYCHVFADPQDPETVYVLNLDCWKSTDGGRTFTEIVTPHGDNHDLWIDPRNPRRMIEGNDGGACVSFNGGDIWSSIYNQPTAQFYHVATDNRFPYRVYGTQQDNSAISTPSRTYKGAIGWNDCYIVGSSESGYIVVDPNDPNVIFSGAIGSSPGGGGSLLRYDHSTGQTRIVTVWPEIYGGYGAKDLKYRFQWTYPILFSPHDPSVLYTAGNLAFRSTDQGTSWEAISPDLTRNDVTKMEPSGGPITKDTTGAEHYCTIFAFVESPHERGVFWAGSDDGLLHISRDGGQSWANVTPSELPEWALISMIEHSPHDPATVYVAATRYKLDDLKPYLYKTNDYGQTWQMIVNGIPAHDFTRVIREDPARRGLLYAGTESGIYISFDDGANWQSLQLNLPAVPIYDLVVKDNDLIAATHGRAFWILDNLALLHQLGDQAALPPVQLFAPPPTHRIALPLSSEWYATPGKQYHVASGVPATSFAIQKPTGELVRTFLDAGNDIGPGLVVNYYLSEQPAGKVTLTFLDAKGEQIRRFSSKLEDQPASPEQSGAGEASPAPADDAATPNEAPTTIASSASALEQELAAPDPVLAAGTEEELSAPSGAKEPQVAKEAGMNRFVWNMRYPDARKLAEDASEAGIPGPLVLPGSYQVQLTVGDQTYTQSFEICKDPRVTTTQADLAAQFDLLMQIREKLSETHAAINQLRYIRQQVEEWARRAANQADQKETWAAIKQAADALKEQLTLVEGELIQTKVRGMLDGLNYPCKLNAKLAALISVVASADAAPTQQSYAVFSELSSRIDQQLAQLHKLVETDLAALNELIYTSQLPAIALTPPA
jgi:photosystem II stability/assembly factor-like uncharacterized protein